MTRILLAVWCVVAVAAPPASAAPAPSAGPAVVLTGVFHSVDGNALVVAGQVENRGPAVTGLVIDAAAFSLRGIEIASGSDGIPWTLASGGRERFSVRLPLGDTLIRYYEVQVALARPPFAPLSRAQHSVDLALYRPFILSLVQVQADVAGGWLIVRSRAGGLPVQQITTSITVLFVARKALWLQTVTVDVPADGTVTVPIGFNAAAISTVRIIDVVLKSTWSD
jgi:hypothetical protein